MDLVEIQKVVNYFIVNSARWLCKADEETETEEMLNALIFSFSYLTKAVQELNDNINFNQIKG
jgi:hypothetical protein